jgi:hypothetical protein
MSSENLNLLLDEAFALWSEMVEFDPDSRYWNNLTREAKAIQEARQLDPAGVTAFMLLKALTHHYIKEEKVSALDMIQGLSPEQEQRLALLRSMYEFLERPEVDGIIEDFIESVRLATAHYGIDHGDLEAWLGDYYELAHLRRDAMRSAEKLEANQFFHGEPAGSERFIYSTKVWEFWNIPSLVRAMQAEGLRGQRGLNLCLVRDPEEALHSFFVITVVNGESLTLLTDRDKAAHPAQKSMSRRPDRELQRRAEKHWFPYDLLELAVTEDQKQLYAKARTALVPINAEAVKLTDFSELHPACAIWLALVFELLRERYLKENMQLPSLSYTTEMLRRPNLLAATRGEIIEAGRYKPLVVEPYTRADVTAESTAGQWVCPPVGHNEWLIERYGDQVPAEAFNIIGEEELRQLPESSAMAPREKMRRPFFSQATGLCELRSMDPLDFGTAEDIESNRLWTARYNQCRVVEHLALKEYEETRSQTRRWINRRLNANRSWLIEEAVRCAVAGKVDRGKFGDERAVVDAPITRIRDKAYWGYSVDTVYINPGGHDATCPITGGYSISYWADIRPVNTETLALMAGCSVRELPWQLQCWTEDSEPINTGNHILNRLDPSDWVLHSPWVQHSHWHETFPISVLVRLSKRGVNQLRKEFGMPKYDWSL